MPSRLPWRNLLPGLVALAIVVVGALAIVKFAGVGSIRGRTIRLFVVSDAANGVMHGTEVWLVGQRVGVVSEVGFLPPSRDSMAHVVIRMTVKASDATAIRRDSRPELRAGANVLSPIVVYLSSGSPTSPAVSDGDTLRAVPQRDVQIAMAKFSDATAELGPLMSDAREVMSSVRSPSGSLGAFLRNGMPVPALRARFTRLTTRDGTGDASHDLMSRARAALARVDSIRTLVSGKSGTLGRFRRDSSLTSTVGNVRDELAVLSARMQAANGTAGRVAHDAALTDAVAIARAQMSALFSDILRRPARYINF